MTSGHLDDPTTFRTTASVEQGGFEHDVSVVLPCYNERETIVDVVRGAYSALDNAGYDAEIIVVDDDSPDRTWQVARDAFEDAACIDVVRRRSDQGLSSAVLDGLGESLGRYAVVMDADGQHPPEKVPALVQALQSGVRDGGQPLDAVVGSRHVEDGKIEGWPWHRHLVSSVATTIASVTVPAARNLEDPMSGFFAIDRATFNRDVLKRCDPHGYKILLELLTHAEVVHGELAVGEVPITFRDRQAGESKMTVDEIVRFIEHCGGLGLVASGHENVYPPLLIRSIELGAVTGGALLLLFLGLWIGDVDGALGAALIAAAGGAVTLAGVRYWNTRETWSETKESYAKG